MHGIALNCWLVQMPKIEFTMHISEKVILHYKYNLFIDVFESSNFMMHLHQDSFSSHFPIDTKTSFIKYTISISQNTNGLQKPLPFRPYCAGCV